MRSLLAPPRRRCAHPPLALALAFALPLLAFACERAPEGGALQPAGAAATANEGDSPPTPEPTLGADGLHEIAGIHYREYISGGAEAEAELPMVIAIHGLGDSPEDFEGLFRGFDRPARVIVPRGLEAHGPGWSWFPIRTAGADPEALAAGIRAAADALAPAITALSKARPTAGKPIVTGFSQGGMLSFALAVEHGELISAAYPMGGALPEPLWPKPGSAPAAAPPILAFHGEADTRVPLAPTQRAVEALTAAGYAVELRTYPGLEHSINRPMHTELMATVRTQLAALTAP